MSAKLSAGRVRQAYRFIEAHRKQFSVQQLCRVLEVAPSGYYEWLQNPISSRAQELFNGIGREKTYRLDPDLKLHQKAGAWRYAQLSAAGHADRLLRPRAKIATQQGLIPDLKHNR